MPGVIVFAEQHSTLLELTGEGRKLADWLGATLTAVTPESNHEAALDAMAHGADGAVVRRLPGGQPLETAAAEPTELAPGADLALSGATLRAKGLAARVAARLGAPLTAEALSLRPQADGALEVDRMVYGGGGIATQLLRTRPMMATIPARTFPAPAAGPRTGEVRVIAVAADARVRVVAQRPRTQEGTDIAEAPAVVGVGRGMAKAEDLALAEALAGTMGGAVGCTRPVAEDLGWLPEDRYIGISGRKVAPRVYVAVGTSGQVQHVSGVRDAKVVVAINKDENAPIFKHADYGLVGDLYTALPALTAELKKLLG